MSLYGQLADQLQQQITSGLWQPGSASLHPSELQDSWPQPHDGAAGLPTAGKPRPHPGAAPIRLLRQGRPLPPAASLPQQAHYSGSVDINDLVFEVLQASKSRELVPLGMAVADPTLFPTPSSRALASSMRRLDPFSTVADLPPATRRCAGPSPSATPARGWR